MKNGDAVVIVDGLLSVMHEGDCHRRLEALAAKGVKYQNFFAVPVFYPSGTTSLFLFLDNNLVDNVGRKIDWSHSMQLQARRQLHLDRFFLAAIAGRLCDLLFSLFPEKLTLFFRIRSERLQRIVD